MSAYDFIMLGVLIVTVLHGFWKGLAWQIASLTAIVLSYFLALRFSVQLAPLFGSQAPLNRFVAMFAIYVATSLVVWLSFRFVSDFINRLKLQEFDRQIGALFGAVKGVLWCVAITFFTLSLLPSARDMVLQSQSGHYIALLLDQANQVMPAEFHELLDPYLHKLHDELEPDGNQPRQPAPATPPIGTGIKSAAVEHPRPFKSLRERAEKAETPFPSGNPGFPTEHKRHYRTLAEGLNTGRNHVVLTRASGDGDPACQPPSPQAPG